jgi:hypothetical protein
LSAKAPLELISLEEAKQQPHVMIDGAALSTSVLTLSHWPGSTTPRGLRRDLSAGMAFAWLRSRRRWCRAVPVSVATDHFDQDGLVGVFALSRPEVALWLQEPLMAVAEVGDFLRAGSAAALRVVSTLSAWAEAARADGGQAAIVDGRLQRRGVEELPALLADQGPYRKDWEEEQDFFRRTDAGVSAGMIGIDEVTRLDLAVVRVPPGWVGGPASQLGRRRPALVHPLAIHRRSRASRVLVLAPPHYEMWFRYETWVRLASRPWRARVDLTAAAAQLSGSEAGAVTWRFNGVSATIARLAPESDSASSLAPEPVLEAVSSALRQPG